MPQDNDPSKVNQSQVAAKNLTAGRDIHIGSIRQISVYLGLSSNSRHYRFVRWLAIGFYLTCLIGVFIRLGHNGADFTNLLLLVIFATPLVTCTGFFVWQLVWQSIPPNNILLLVANFDGQDQKDYRLTEKFLRNLEEAVKPYPDVKVQALDRAITAQQGSDIARAEGKRRKATIVIWGWYGVPKDFNVIVNFELIRPPDYFPKITEGTQTLTDGQTLAVSELNSFTLPTSLNGMSYLTLFTIGMARYAAEDWDGAIDRFSNALAQVETNVLTLVQYAVYFYRGTSYVLKSDNKSAIADYNQALKLKPDFALAYNNRGGAYNSQGNYIQAIADCNQALKLRPDFALAYSNRGGAYNNRGNYTQAIADCNQALKLKSDYVVAYNNRGRIYNNQGNHTQAIADYTHALKLKPNYAEAYNNRGVAYGNQGNHTQAIADYTHALKLKPNYAEAYNNRGVAYGNQGNYTQAIADCNQALKLHPNYAEAYTNRGVTYDNQGNHTQAIADYDQALKLKPNLALAYYNKACVYSLKRDIKAAIENLQRATDLDAKLREDAKTDSDFDNIRKDKQFQALVRK